MIVATHWHDDHTGGLLQLLKTCRRATFHLSAALTKSEVHTVLEIYGSRPPALAGSGVSELRGVMEHLIESDRQHRRAKQGQVLRWVEAKDMAHGFACKLVALSPSDYSEESFLRNVIQFIPTGPLEPKRRMVDLSPNHASVALWLEIGPIKAIFGADLEDVTDKRGGWKAYLAADNCPPGKAALFKVPHHGSKNAHNDRLWAERLEESPVTVTTPWQLGGGSLPSADDVERIRQLSGAAFVTSSPKAPRAPRRPTAVTKQIRESGVELRRVPVSSGAVRFRTAPNFTANPHWCIELIGSAQHI